MPGSLIKYLFKRYTIYYVDDHYDYILGQNWGLQKLKDLTTNRFLWIKFLK